MHQTKSRNDFVVSHVQVVRVEDCGDTKIREVLEIFHKINF